MNSRGDSDDLIWRLAILTIQLHEGIGDRPALLIARADLWREAELIGLFEPRFKSTLPK